MAHKVKRLFPRYAACQLKCDYEGLYSLTPENESTVMAEIMADVCWQVLRRPASSTNILDGTAGLGGNVFGFARFFAHVRAMELDEKRYKLLQHNIQQLGWAEARVECIRGTVLKLFMHKSSPMVFLDPPWGGYSYRREKNLRLYISKVPLPRLLRQWAQQRKRAHPTVVGLKLPTNFSLALFQKDLQGAPVRMYSTHKLSKMLLVIVLLL